MKIIRIFCVAIIPFIAACEKDEDPAIIPTISSPTSLTIKDIANFANARDIKVSFNKPPDLTYVEEFRVFIVKAANITSFDSTAAINNTTHLSVSKESLTSEIRFGGVQTDTEGDVIVEQTAYRVFVMTMGTSESGLGGVLSSPSGQLTLRQNNIVRTLTSSIDGGTGGMDVDEDGNIFMADFGATTGGPPGTRVFKITPTGTVSTFAGGLSGASGNDFDADGNLFQSNISAGTVSKITPEGLVSTFATGLRGPVGIVVTREKEYYVCNCSTNSISKIDSLGNVSEFASSSLLNCPNGIDIDGSGNLYVANFSSNNLIKITPDGNVSVLATMPGNNNGHLLVRGTFIYIISRGLHQIHRVTLNGSVTLFAGNGQRGIVDGPLLEASFSLPNDLAFSPDGKYIYINDVNGSSPDGSVISPSIIRVIELVE